MIADMSVSLRSQRVRSFQVHADPDVVICLVGNKCDRPITVDIKAIEGLAKSIDAKFVKCSALTGEGVDSAFTALSARIVDNFKGRAEASKRDPGIVLAGKVNTEESKAGCC